MLDGLAIPGFTPGSGEGMMASGSYTGINIELV